MAMKQHGKHRTLIKKGKKLLSTHSTHQALKLFREASSSIQPENGKDLSESLYWMGICLLKLGKPDLALNAFSSVIKLRKTAYGKRMYRRFCNPYGMLKRESSCLDDFYAFFSIKTMQITALKNTDRFPTTLDGETLFKQLVAVWKHISDTQDLVHCSLEEKKRIFTHASLPFISLQTAFFEETIIPVHFRTGKVLTSESRCFCGSGLTYGCCCGRIKTPKDYCIG